MYIQSDLENKPYKISKRNFLDDYAHYTSNEVDMTLSGKYLYKYPKFTIDYEDCTVSMNFDTKASAAKWVMKAKLSSAAEATQFYKDLKFAIYGPMPSL